MTNVALAKELRNPLHMEPITSAYGHHLHFDGPLRRSSHTLMRELFDAMQVTPDR